MASILIKVKLLHVINMNYFKLLVRVIPLIAATKSLPLLKEGQSYCGGFESCGILRCVTGDMHSKV